MKIRQFIVKMKHKHTKLNYSIIVIKKTDKHGKEVIGSYYIMTTIALQKNKEQIAREKEVISENIIII